MSEIKNIFQKEVTDEVIERINTLEPTNKPNWGKMTADQMLAHCNVTYEYLYTDKHAKPKGFKKWMLNTFVKKIVVSDKPYKKSSPTAPEFKMISSKDFGLEKQRLIDHLKQTQEHGEQFFDNKESHAFGKLNKNEWNNMFYKHLDHHLKQFGK